MTLPILMCPKEKQILSFINILLSLFPRHNCVLCFVFVSDTMYLCQSRIYLLNPIRTLAQLIICSRSLIITWPFHQFQSFKLKCKTQDTRLNNPNPKHGSNPQNIEKMWPKIAAKGGFCSAVRGHLWCSRG